MSSRKFWQWKPASQAKFRKASQTSVWGGGCHLMQPSVFADLWWLVFKMRTAAWCNHWCWGTIGTALNTWPGVVWYYFEHVARGHVILLQTCGQGSCHTTLNIWPGVVSYYFKHGQGSCHTTLNTWPGVVSYYLKHMARGRVIVLWMCGQGLCRIHLSWSSVHGAEQQSVNCTPFSHADFLSVSVVHGLCTSWQITSIECSSDV